MVTSDKQFVELLEAAIAAWKAFRDYAVSQDGGAVNNTQGYAVLTETQIAKGLQVSLSTLRKERKKGRYPFFFREGGRWVTTPVLYAKWLETHEKRAGAK